MTILATPEAPAPQAPRTAIQAHHDAMVARIEDWVFFTTVLGMDPVAAYYRAMGAEAVHGPDAASRETALEAIRRWRLYLADHPEEATWHAAPSRHTCRRRGTQRLPSALAS